MATSRPRRKPATSTRRALLKLDLRHGGAEELASVIEQLLEQSTLASEERVQILGGALVMEALRPYWGADRSPTEAHEALRSADPELAAAVEAIAPMLLGRVEAREDARAAVEAVEALLGAR